MDEIKWIKIVTDVFDNRKIKMIEAMPEGDALLIVWFKILTLAGQINDGGLVYFTKDIPYTEQLLATQFNRPLSIIQLALNTFERLGMIEIANDVIMVSNWEKYQNVDGMEKVREQTRKRVADYRQRQKALVSNVTSNATVTVGNATEERKKNKKEKKNITPNTLTSITPNGGDTHTDYESEFEGVWKLYPKKQGKVNALKDYIKARKSGVSRKTIEDGITAYSDYCRRNDRFFKDGSTWFHQKCWEEDYSEDEPFKKATGCDDLGYSVSEYAEQMKREGLL